MEIYALSKLRLSDAGDDANVAYYSRGYARLHHANSARQSMVRAMSGASDGPEGKDAREELADTISQAITDTLDADWQPEHAAGAVIDAILDACLPLPKDESDA